MMTVGSLALSTVKLFADQVKHPTTRIYMHLSQKKRMAINQIKIGEKKSVERNQVKVAALQFG